MRRVLKPGGRAVISDIVSDQDVPERLQRDPELWSGCLSGAFREDRLLAAFEQAGFNNCQVVARQAEPWAVVEGIQFRSVTVRAWNGAATLLPTLQPVAEPLSGCCGPSAAQTCH
jgi:hypothetical protein